MNKLLVILFGILSCLTSLAEADLVWLCSKYPSKVKQNEEFFVAAGGTNPQILLITLRDLYDVYTGKPVQLSGLPLSACYIPGNAPESTAAFKFLGLPQHVADALSRHNSIVQNHLFPVANSSEMAECIYHHFPAVGYSLEELDTEKVSSCF